MVSLKGRARRKLGEHPDYFDRPNAGLQRECIGLASAKRVAHRAFVGQILASADQILARSKS